MSVAETDFGRTCQAIGRSNYNKLQDIETSSLKKPKESNFVNKLKKRKLICQSVFNILTLILVTCIVLLMFLTYVNSKGSSPQGQSIALLQSKSEKSCLGLRQSGMTQSGVYEIQSTTYYQQTSTSGKHFVYCDMKTDGGGWTLVASVHRGQDGTKCSNHDKWSFYPNNSYRRQNGEGSPTWSDRSVMGSVFTATSEDYKSAEYYNQKSSDVMLSHVPNDIDVSDFETESFLKYHTTDGFLSKYEYSLATLYRDHVPLKSLNIIGLDLRVIAQIGTRINISSIVSGWYNYSYDAGTSGTFIRDGGGNMFDVGNQVYFRLNNEPYTLMEYGKSYTDSKSYHVSSAANYPFIALASISNFDGYPNKFSMKVVSTMSDVNSTTGDYFTATHNGFYIQAKVLDVYGSTEKPSITSVLFSIRGDQKWASAASTSSFPFTHPVSMINLTYEFSTSGPIKNIVMGYMLLSRKDPNYVHRGEIEILLYKIIDLLDLPENNILKLNSPQPQVVTKVKIVNGSITYPDHNVTSGYLQFGAYDHFGYPYAMCPGVRVNDGADPSQYCIGSSDTSLRHRDRCGDFSAWEILQDHAFRNRSNNGRFVNDLHSTILIFIR